MSQPLEPIQNSSSMAIDYHHPRSTSCPRFLPAPPLDHQAQAQAQATHHHPPSMSHSPPLISSRLEGPQPLPVSESHFTEDLKPIPLSRLTPISTRPSEPLHSPFEPRLPGSTSQSNPPSPSSDTIVQDDQSDSESLAYYTSGSESEFDLLDLSPKQRAKRERLKLERDLIKPSYYYGEKELEEEALQRGIKPPKPKRKGLRGIPVFEPSMEQFQDFYSYINRIDRWGMRSGIVKIIPPKEWSQQLPNLGQESLRTDGQGQMLRNAKIKSPISQVIQGSRGLFRVMNVAKRRGYNALEWYDLANSAEHRPPDFFNKTIPTVSECLEQTHPEMTSTRSTRSSRRSATSIAPISHKASNSRRRKVSKGHSIADGCSTEQNSPSKQSTELPPDSSPSNLSYVSANLIQSCRNLKDHITGVPPPVPAPTLAHPPSPQSSLKPEGVASRIESFPVEENGISANGGAGADTCPTPPKLSQIQSLDDTEPSKVLLPSSTTPNESPLPLGDSPDQVKKNKPKRIAQSGPTPEEWAQFVERYDELPYGASKSDYTFQICREIEQEYWRTIGNGGEPMYGADSMGSLFDERTKHWNVANLDNLLNRLKLKKKIPGVNSPYLYFGSWRATFAWHVEDADLYSINYIHFGAPKFWYAIPQEHNARFEHFMSASFAKERRTCPQFLRHKAFLASPSVLQSVGVQLNKVVHLPGEIILTYPYGYHSGFNLGYNCAESVNFANEAWIEKGKRAQSCKCIDDAVTINVDAWLQEHEELSRKENEARSRAARKLERKQLQEQRKRERNENPDQNSPKRKKPNHKSKELDQKLPSATTDNKSAALSGLWDPSLIEVAKPPKIVKPKQAQPRKKPESRGNCATVDPLKQNGLEKSRNKRPSGSGSGAHSSHKRPSVGIHKTVFPCALCPDLSEDGLVRILEEDSFCVSEDIQSNQPGDKSINTIDGPCPEDNSSNQVVSKPDSVPEPVDAIQPSLKTHPRSKPKRWAHKVCCMFTPSTWIEKLPSGEEVVKGFEAIEKARWALKCQLCSEKMGIKVQCTKSKKCAKACHVTCGLKTGIFFIDAKLVNENLTYSLLDPSPSGPPPGLDIGQDPTLVVLCKQHNPIHQKAKAERKAKELNEKIGSFEVGQPLKVRTSQGVFQVVFVSRDEYRRTLTVTFEDGHSSIMPYTKVYFDCSDCYSKKVGPRTSEPQSLEVARDYETKPITSVLPPNYDDQLVSMTGAQSSDQLSATMAITSSSSPAGHQPLEFDRSDSKANQSVADSGKLQLLVNRSAVDSIEQRPVHPSSSVLDISTTPAESPPTELYYLKSDDGNAPSTQTTTALEAGLIDSRLFC